MQHKDVLPVTASTSVLENDENEKSYFFIFVWVPIIRQMRFHTITFLCRRCCPGYIEVKVFILLNHRVSSVVFEAVPDFVAT